MTFRGFTLRQEKSSKKVGNGGSIQFYILYIRLAGQSYGGDDLSVCLCSTGYEAAQDQPQVVCLYGDPGPDGGPCKGRCFYE